MLVAKLDFQKTLVALFQSGFALSPSAYGRLGEAELCRFIRKFRLNVKILNSLYLPTRR